MWPARKCGSEWAKIHPRPTPRTPTTRTRQPLNRLQNQCTDCGLILKGQHSAGNLTRHKKSKACSSGNDATFPCSTCNKSFLRSDARLKHERKKRCTASGAKKLTAQLHKSSLETLRVHDIVRRLPHAQIYTFYEISQRMLDTWDSHKCMEILNGPQEPCIGSPTKHHLQHDQTKCKSLVLETTTA
jgi:hypothetical protein